MTIETIAANIMNWDKQDVEQLRDMIADLHEECEQSDTDPQAFINMSNLPTAEFPAGVDTGYPVWAMDVHGNCLTGDDASDIESVEDVMA